MARPKTVTIKLSPKPRAELKRLTGENHSEVMFESVKLYRSGKIASKATLGEIAAKRPGLKNIAAKRPGMREISAKRAGLKEISAKRAGLKEISAKRAGLKDVVKN